MANNLVPYDLVSTWLDDSKNTPKAIPLTNVSRHMAKFFYVMCHDMSLPKEVFFTALSVLDNMLEKMKNNSNVNFSTKILTTIVFLSTKFAGMRHHIHINPFLDMLNRVEEEQFDQDDIKLLEEYVLLKLDFQLPLSTTLQDLQNLIDVIVKPIVKDVHMLNQILYQSTTILVFICMYMQEVWAILDEFYKENDIMHYSKGLKSERLFIPTGILLYILICNRDELGADYSIVRNAVIKYTTIHAKNYKVLVTLIREFGNVVKDQYTLLSY